MRTRLVSLLVLSIALVAIAPAPVEGTRGMVASDHLLASEAGSAVLAQGGNAVDAAVATALAAGVVQPAGSGLGGGGFAVVQLADGPQVLDFREVAPAAASRDMYLDDAGEPVDSLSRSGGLAVAVPGEARGLALLHERHGTLSLAKVVQPAIDLARKGFPVGVHLSNALMRFPAVSEQLFGSVPKAGAFVSRPGLARTLRAFATSKGEALHDGAVAKAIAEASRETGGVLTLSDLQSYAPLDRKPVTGQYRGYTVITMPPPSSGGAVILQMLSVLEAWNLKDLGHNSSEYLHLVAEVMQHAFADRAHFMGDPDFVEVPLDRILSPERIEQVQRSFWPDRTHPRDFYGIPVAVPEDAGTQHISVLDADGMAVALTTTINTSFGSGVVVDGYGVILNNEMDDFAAKPGSANAYGLVQGESNAVVPGKRPLSSMTPTIVLNPEGEVVLVVGASGGPQIISGTLQAILNVVDFGMDAQEAVSAPRMHHQWLPELTWIEPGIPQDVVRGLEARGHTVMQKPHFSAVQLVSKQDGRLYGAADPRKGGQAAGPDGIR